MMGAFEDVKALLEGEGIRYEHVKHAPTFTAQETAAATHISGKELAKVVMLKVGDELVMAVTPASRRVDLKKFKKLAGGGKARLAKEEEFTSRFPDCEAGAMSPLGSLYGMDVYEDESLTSDEEIAFNAGTHKDVLKIKHSDFQRVVEPKVGDFIVSGDR